MRLAICVADPVLRGRIVRALAGTDISVIDVTGDPDAMHALDPDRVDAVLTDALGDQFNWFPPPDEAREASVNLTARERDVLAALADGASNKVIARRLGISFHTAKFHVNSILTKLNAGTRTEAVMRGIRTGLIMI